MVRVADRTKTQWWVCVCTAIAVIVSAVESRPKDWAQMVQKKGSAGFATTNRKCKLMI